MTLPVTGPHDWHNFTDYWREQDAEWLQARSILRVDTASTYTVGSTMTIAFSQISTPQIGQTVYAKVAGGTVGGTLGWKDTLFVYAHDRDKNGINTAAWVPYPAMPKYLYATTDTSTSVVLGHHVGNPAAAVPAITFTQTGAGIPNDLTVRSGVLKVTAADVQIKTGATTVALTTDANGLVSDKPIKAAGFVSTGAITAVGQTISAATVDATTAHINTVESTTLRGTTVETTDAKGYRYKVDVPGFLDQGRLTGDTTGVILHGPRGGTPGAWGDAQIHMTKDDIRFQGTWNTMVDNTLRINKGHHIEWYTGASDNVFLGNSGPVIYSATEPNVALYPVGSIWVS